jgi:hypothetical protein
MASRISTSMTSSSLPQCRESFNHLENVKAQWNDRTRKQILNCWNLWNTYIHACSALILEGRIPIFLSVTQAPAPQIIDQTRASLISTTCFSELSVLDGLMYMTYLSCMRMTLPSHSLRAKRTQRQLQKEREKWKSETSDKKGKE